jgi:hypothetical protein
MTGDQSRLLKRFDRVRWGATTTDLGTVVETTWSGVTINWDDGRTTSIFHSDMKSPTDAGKVGLSILPNFRNYFYEKT